MDIYWYCDVMVLALSSFRVFPGLFGGRPVWDKPDRLLLPLTYAHPKVGEIPST